MRRYGQQVSPERTKVWVEPPPKYQYQKQLQQGRKVPVVYYLCKNRHLEHPHFIEVALSSNEGLYLRDVINRLNVLRGKKMAAMYSWSCKRSYKNGFVWHDVAEDDLLFPAQGNEYVLKGSELLDQSPIDRRGNGLTNAKIKLDKHHGHDSPVSSKPDEASFSSSPTAIVKEAENVPSPSTPSPPPMELIRARVTPAAREDESSPSTHRSGSSGEFSPEPIVKIGPSSTLDSPSAKGYRNCKNAAEFSPGTIGAIALSSTLDSPSAKGYRNCKNAAAQDASTQTEHGGNTTNVIDTRIVGVSTDEGSSNVEYKESQSECMPQPKLVPEIVVQERSPPPASSSASSSCGRTSTLESLIRDEIRKGNSFRIVEEEVFVPTRAKLKATNMLMQLISCGSIAVKDHYNFGFVPTYRPSFNNVKFPSPLISNPVVLSELDCLSESQRVMGLREQEKEYFTGGMTGARKCTEMVDGILTLKRPSSFDEERSSNIPNSKRDKEKAVDGLQSRCLPRTMNIVSCKHSKNDMNEAAMSPIQDIRTLSAGPASCRSSPLNLSIIGSKRIMDSSSVKDSSRRFESFSEEKDKVIKIEERLASGARVVIQSRSPCYDEDCLE